jgi:hypothetical protein
MRPISPDTGAPEVVFAEEQEEYMPLSVALYRFADGARGLLTRWKPTDAERHAILNGEDVYIMQLHFSDDSKMTPLAVRVGPDDWK